MKISRFGAAAVAAIASFGIAGGSAAVAVGLASAPIAAQAEASAGLRAALSTLKGLSDHQFHEVVSWARNNGFAPGFGFNAVQNAEIQIGNLNYDDRQALLSWLKGNGRAALYNRGASDWQIGGRHPGNTPKATPTPNPYRQLELTSPTLGKQQTGSIAVLGGFAAASRDGKMAMACVSFQNNAPVAATQVNFTFTLLDANGNTVGTMQLDRTGTFSTGIGIMSWSSFNDWNGGSGFSNRGYSDNCAKISNGVAALPIIQARYVTYTISGITYADGTTWPHN